MLLTIGVFLAGLFVVDRLERRAADEVAEEARRGELAVEERRTSDGLDTRTMRTADEPVEMAPGDAALPTESADSTRLAPLTGPAVGAIERWAAGLDGVPYFARTAADDSEVSILLLDGLPPEAMEPIDAAAVRLAQGSEPTDEAADEPAVTDAVPPFILEGVVAEIAAFRPASAIYRLVDDPQPDGTRAAVREYLLLFSSDTSFLLRFYVEEDEVFDVEISPAE